LTDHLWNVRATLKPSTATTGTVIQKHDYSFVFVFVFSGIYELCVVGYCPFGKSRALQISGINKYLYNGKEVQSELGDQQDYSFVFVFSGVHELPLVG